MTLLGISLLLLGFVTTWHYMQSNEDWIKKNEVLMILGFLTSVGLTLVMTRLINSGELSINPIGNFKQAFYQDGFLDGVFVFGLTLLFLSWAFAVIAHAYSSNHFQKTGERIYYPYVINIVIGITLCQENNILFRALIKFNEILN